MKKLILTVAMTFLILAPLTGFAAPGRNAARIRPVARHEVHFGIPGNLLRAKPQQWDRSRYTFISPDRRYEASVEIGEAEAVILTIKARMLKNTGGHLRTLFLMRDVHGVLWLPKRRHTLVFASSAIYGRAMCAVWNGHTTRSLVPARALRDGDFELLGVTKDERWAIYQRQSDYLTPGKGLEPKIGRAPIK